MRAQCQLSTAIAYGLNAFQVFVQFNAVVGYVVCILCTGSYYYIAVTAYGCAVCIYGVNHMSVICGSLVYLSNVSATFNLSFSCGCYCADVFQLAIVYCVSISSTCRNAGNLAVLVNTNNIINNSTVIHHKDRCAFTVDNTCSTCCTIQCQFSTAVGNGSNIS